MTNPPQYAEQIRKEAAHWGSVRPDPRNPQLWHDPLLFNLFFARELSRLRRTAASHGPNLLELGCGEGSLAVSLAQEGLSVTGIDLSPERIERARERATETGVSDRMSFRVADLNVVELPAGSFSCVFAHDSLHHILNLDHLLEEVRKCLTENGVFIVMDYHGMGKLRKLLAAGITAISPTYRSYREKWNSRRGFKAFIASERTKRNALRSGDSTLLHPDSPFEEISQASLVPAIERHFNVRHYHTYLPFWFYLAPKIRIPNLVRPLWGRSMRALDSIGSAIGMKGAYFYLEAIKDGNASASH